MHNHSRYKRQAGGDTHFPLAVVVRRFRSENMMQVAAALAFTTLLSLVPLVTLVLAVADAIPYLSPLLASLDVLVRNTLLPNGVAGTIAGNISSFSHKAQRLTVPGLLLLGVSAFLLVHTIERAFNHVWQVKPRPLAARVRLYALTIVVWPFLLAAIVAAVSYALTVSLGVLTESPWSERAALRVLLLGLLGLFLALLYYAVPNARVGVRPALLAGLCAMLAFVGLQKVFELYLVKSAIVKSVYGAFAAFPVFLVWLHMCWVVVLGGGLVAATLSRPGKG